MKHSKIPHYKPLLALLTGLVLASLGFAQQPNAQDDKRSVWDKIDPNDAHVVGLVAEVREESFSLRTHEGLFLFDIPTDPDQAADVRTGNEVQVWYDPDGYDRDGDTYYPVSRVITADQVSEMETSATTSSEMDDERDEMRDPVMTAEATATGNGEVQEQEWTDADDTAVSSVADDDSMDYTVDNDSMNDDANQDWENADGEQMLPQTAGSMPFVALAGLITLLSAAALRYRAS